MYFRNDHDIAALNSAEAQLSNVVQRIQMLEVELKRELDVKAGIEQEIATLQRQPTTRSLPNEILLEIFEHVILHNPTPKQRDTIRLVCKTWNAFFEEGIYPTLWADIFVPVPVRIPQHLDLMHACILFCIKCVKFSGVPPLRITLDYSGPGRILYDNAHISLLLIPLSTLQGPEGSVAARWESFSIIAAKEFHFLEPHMGSFGNLQLNNLRTLFVAFGIPARSLNIRHLISRPLPHLHTVYFRRYVPGFAPPTTSTIQRFELVECDHQALYSTFNLPQLTTLVIQEMIVDDGQRLRVNSLQWQLSSLVTLQISGSLPLGFWTNVDFPRMETVQFMPSRSNKIGALALEVVASFFSVPVSNFPRLRLVGADESLVPEQAADKDWRRSDGELVILSLSREVASRFSSCDMEYLGFTSRDEQDLSVDAEYMALD